MLILIKLLQACIFATFGKIYASWFMRTKAGKWLQAKIDKFMFYLAVKYNLEMAKKEAKWKKDYPGLAVRIDSMEARLKMYSQYPNE